MLAQRIRKVSKVHQSILRTKRFLILLFNEDPIRQPSLGYIWRQDVSLQWGKGSLTCLYLGDLVTHTGDQKICSVSGRLLDYPRELGCMIIAK